MNKQQEIIIPSEFFRKLKKSEIDEDCIRHYV